MKRDQRPASRRSSMYRLDHAAQLLATLNVLELDRGLLRHAIAFKRGLVAETEFLLDLGIEALGH